MINLCLFGAGRIARIHAANIALHSEMILRSVVDLRQDAAQALAEPYGARAGADPEAALADPAVDAVLIASSSNTHADLIMRAVAAKIGAKEGRAQTVGTTTAGGFTYPP